MAARVMRKTLNWYAGLWPKRIPRPPYDHIVQVGDPILRLKCENVPLESINTEETKKVISSLKDVMAAYECVGLAAPQIGIGKRIFVMEMNEKRLKESDLHMIEKCQMFAFPLMVFINPTLKVIDTTKVTHMEACESVKGFCAEVARYQEVQINGYNEEGSLVSIKFGGWPSRIAQHEMDHLDGQNYVDIMNKDTFACHLWREVNLHAGKIKLPFSAC